MSSRTYPGLDLVRFAAALLVVFYHLGFWLWRGDPSRQISGLAPLVAAGWVGVPIFFVISGFVITFSANDRSAAEFVRSRVSRLYPAAWICASVSFLLAPSTIETYLRTMLLLPIGPWVSGGYWTLAIEIVFYALIAVALTRKWPLTNVALCLGGYSTAFWVLKAANLAIGSPVDFSVIENYTGYLLLAHDGIFFAFGMLLYKRAHPIPAILFAATGLVAIAWRSHALGIAQTPFFVAPIVWLAATLGATVMVFANRQLETALRKWPVRTIGLMTYPLYLLHFDVGRAVMLAFASPYIGLPVALVTVLLAAFAVLPAEKRIRRTIFRTGRPEAVASLP